MLKEDLSEKVAVVTGAGSGIGAAMARRLAAEGMRLVVADINQTTAEATAKALSDAGGEAVGTHVEVGDADSAAQLAQTAADLGGCYVLCANAAVQNAKRADSLAADDWNWVIGVNLLGTVQTIESLLPVMRATPGQKQIVVTSSICGLFPTAHLATYTASKYAVTAYAETRRIELEPEHIGVTVFFPGIVLTDHINTSQAARPARFGPAGEIDDEAMREMFAALIPSPESVVDPDYATRNLVAAISENRPYLFSHSASTAPIVARFDALSAALARADD